MRGTLLMRPAQGDLGLQLSALALSAARVYLRSAQESLGCKPRSTLRGKRKLKVWQQPQRTYSGGPQPDASTGHAAGHLLNSRADAWISPTTTKITIHGGIDLLISGLRVFIEHPGNCQDLVSIK